MLKITKRQLDLFIILASLNISIKLTDNQLSKYNLSKLNKDVKKVENFSKSFKNVDDIELIIIDEAAINKNSTDKLTSSLTPSQSLKINYGSKANNPEVLECRRKYFNTIEKYANMYGLDSELVFAQACQERMEHSDIIDEGGAIGLMQIQASIWIGHTIKVYNYDKCTNEEIEITEELIKTLDGNIKVSCAIMQQYLKKCDYNPLAALQTYNSGNIILNEIIPYYALDNKKTTENILNNITDIGWVSYCNEYNVPGDPNYIENVLNYYNNYKESLSYKRDDEIITIPVTYQEKIYPFYNK